MNYRKSIIGSSGAFIIGTSCCWLPALIIAIGGGITLVGISNGLEAFSGIFIAIGIGFLGFGIYQYQDRKNTSSNYQAILQSRITCPERAHEKEQTMPPMLVNYFTNVRIAR